MKKNPNGLEIDLSGLSSVQKRIIRSLNASLLQVMTTQSEHEFFQEGLDVFSKVAQCLDSSKFNSQKSTATKIPYARQVLEYSLDCLQEEMQKIEPISLDN